jgi:signal transduction histidine kinase
VSQTELKIRYKQLERRLMVFYCFGLIALALASISFNFLLKREAARQATSLIKRTVERGDFRETIYTLNEAKLDYFDAVIYYSEEGSRMFSIPPQLDPALLDRQRLQSQLLYSSISTDLFFGGEGGHKTGSVLFVFNRFSLVPYAGAIWLFFLFGVVPILYLERKRIANQLEKEILSREESSRADLARRVRHDIRSPLGALQIATQSLNGLPPPQQNLIRKGMERLAEIVAELELIRGPQVATARPHSSEVPSPQAILPLVQEIVQEKRLQLPDGLRIIPEFAQDAFFLFAKVQASEFKRALSNIIDNAVEACENKGRVIVRLLKKEASVVIEISDNGKGIARDDLERVTQKGFTRKPRGSGLGLYYSEKTIREAGGQLSIRSQPSDGATVTIQMPACKPPEHYVASIQIPNHSTVVVLDDQESSHLCWRSRFDELRAQGARFETAAFTKVADFLNWHRTADRSGVIYLFDYDLGENQKNGLEVAQELGLGAKTILVTGHYDAADIQRECSRQRVRLLPKSYVSLVELETV